MLKKLNDPYIRILLRRDVHRQIKLSALKVNLPVTKYIELLTKKFQLKKDNINE